MFDIHFRRHPDSREDRIVIAKGLPILEAARKARVVSGDLVVWAGTNRIVQSEAWLFDWEKKDSNCYARHAIRADNPAERLPLS